jgi:WD40 repeat protein
VAFSPDGRTMAIGYFGGDVELWDVRTLQRRAVSRDEARQKRSIALLVFSPDGKTLVAASGEPQGRFNLSVTLWDVPRLTIRARLDDAASAFDASSFSPDGKTLLLKSAYGLPRLWEVATGRDVGAFKGHIGRVNYQEFSPDGRTLTTAGDDGSVILWDADAFQEIVSLKGHTRPVTDIAYSPDRRRLASAGSDGSVKIWAGATDRDVVAHYEREARLSPDDTDAQVNLALACWGLSRNHDPRDPGDRDEAWRRLKQGRDALVRLRDARRIGEQQAGWIREFDAALERQATGRGAAGPGS